MRLYVYILLFSLGFLQGQYRDIPEVVTKVATSAANWLKLETSARARSGRDKYQMDSQYYNGDRLEV